jgi:hypothetical protein
MFTEPSSVDDQGTLDDYVQATSRCERIMNEHLTSDLTMSSRKLERA